MQLECQHVYGEWKPYVYNEPHSVGMGGFAYYGRVKACERCHLRVWEELGCILNFSSVSLDEVEPYLVSQGRDKDREVWNTYNV